MASQRISCLIGALLLVLVANVTIASKTTIIDDAEIETIAETVCKLTRGSHTQISRVSTIGKLVEFFKNLPATHKLTSCAEKYSNALDQLQQVVTQSNDNVCSEQKLTLIERFHRDFISRTWRDKQQQKFGKLVAPKILTLFFMHYAARVSATCKQSLLNQKNGLEAMTTNPEGLETVDKLLREFWTKVGNRAELKGYDDIILSWSLVDKFPLKKKDEEYLSPPGNRKRIYLKANSTMAEKLESFQTICSTKLKPAYGASVLPILRLADLGYYLDTEQFSAELAGQPNLRRKIGITQLCESILPVKVFKDDTLKSGQVVLITRDEAGPIHDDGQEEIQLSTKQEDDEQNSLASLNALESVNPDEGHLVARRLRANIRGRERILRRLFAMMSQQLRDKAKSLTGKLFLSSDRGKVDVATVVSDESNVVPAEGLEPHNDGSLVRRKRNIFLSAITYVFLVIVRILDLILAVVLLVPLLILSFFVYIFFGNPD